MKKLAVAETFYSIQGEGQTMGIPAVFLRLGGCNLLCESQSWRCDTIEVWKKSVATPFEEVLKEEYVKRIQQGAHLVITGGEPLMHMKHIVEYLNWFMQTYNCIPVVEVETNGTISPNFDITQLVNFWNVSPKLSSAGEQNPHSKRVNPMALNYFSSFFGNEKHKTIFKFVVSKEEDVLEILQDFAPYIQMDLVALMPAGSSQEELSKTRLFVANKCIELGLRYSERLHIVIFNQKTGV